MTADLTAPCPRCGFYRDTPNHAYGCPTRPVVPLAEKDEAMSLEERVADLLVKFRGEAVSSGDLHYATIIIADVRSEIARDIEARLHPKVFGAVTESFNDGIHDAARIARNGTSS